MMTPEIIQMIAQFMGRVQLAATEIDAFQTCQKELQEEYERAMRPPEVPLELPKEVEE